MSDGRRIRAADALSSAHMKLYGDRNPAPNPRRVRIFLAEKGISLPYEEVPLRKAAHKRPAFRQKNSLGQVPVLELDDGTTLSESVSICRYLEELYPTPSLFGTHCARARASRHVDPAHGVRVDAADCGGLGAHPSDHRGARHAVQGLRRGAADEGGQGDGVARPTASAGRVHCGRALHDGRHRCPDQRRLRQVHRHRASRKAVRGCVRGTRVLRIVRAHRHERDFPGGYGVHMFALAESGSAICARSARVSRSSASI